MTPPWIRGRRGGAAAGFTLLEIAITVVILGIVIATIYGVFARTLAAKERAEALIEDTRSARAALARMTRDLQAMRTGPRKGPRVARQGAPPPPQTPAGGAPTAVGTPRPGTEPFFLSHNRTEGGVPLDDLAFSATVHRPAASLVAPRDLATIRYFVDLISDSRQLGLFRETIYSLSGQTWDPDKPDPASTTLVAGPVTGFEVRFFDGRDWVQEWDSTDLGSYSAAPMAVELTLQVADSRGGVETYQTAVDLPLVRPPPGKQVVPGSKSDDGEDE